MKRVGLLYLSLILVLLSKSVIVYGQAYVLSGSQTQKATVAFPGPQSVPAIDLPPGTVATNCKDVSCWKEEVDRPTTVMVDGVTYVRVKFKLPTGDRVGWIKRDNLKDTTLKKASPKEPPLKTVIIPIPEEKQISTTAPKKEEPPKSQASFCWTCWLSGNDSTTKTKEAIEKHDSDASSILAKAKEGDPLKEKYPPPKDPWCGPKSKSRGENLWNKIGATRRPDAAPKCGDRRKKCAGQKKDKTPECLAAEELCKEATAACRGAKDRFEASCDIFAGLTPQERVAEIDTKVGPVLNRLPKEEHPDFVTKELILCLMRREGENFIPSASSGNACVDIDADDFGLGGIKFDSLDNYWERYHISSPSTKITDLRDRFHTSRNMYYSMPENVSSQIEMIALFLNAKYQDGFKQLRRNGIDACDRMEKVPKDKQNPTGYRRVYKDSVPISAKDKLSDLATGRGDLRRTLRWYDNCGKQDYPNVIFSCMDKLKGQSDERMIELLTPLNQEMKKAMGAKK